MQNLIKSKIIISFGVFGLAFTFFLSLLSGSSFTMILMKSVLGGLILGGVGAALDFFLKRSLSSEDYSRLVRFGKGFESGVKDEYTLDVVDEAPEDSGKAYRELYRYNNEETDLPREERNETIFDNTPGSITTESDIRQAKYSGEEEKFSPDIQKMEEFKEEDFSNIPRVSSSEENISGKTASYSDDIPKVDKIKKEGFKKESGREGVTFKLKNRVITADPGLVAKAIKTVLHKEQ